MRPASPSSFQGLQKSLHGPPGRASGGADGPWVNTPAGSIDSDGWLWWVIPGLRKPQGKWDSVHSSPQNSHQHSSSEGLGSERPNNVPLAAPDSYSPYRQYGNSAGTDLPPLCISGTSSDI